MKLVVRLLVPGLLLAAAAGGLAFYGHRLATQPFRGYVGEEIFFNVSPGQTSSSIAGELERKGIIMEKQLFLTVLAIRGATESLKAGEYRFNEPTSTLDVIDRLVEGDVYHLTVTIPEGLSLLETAALLSEKGLGDAGELGAAFTNAGLIASIDPEAVDLEGYLFPDTYQFPRNPPPDDVARAMVSRFKNVFDEPRREKAKELELEIREVVTFASIVEKETGLAEERPLIASVFWNRLERRMALQSDPTIIYDLKRQGRFDGNLRRADLKLDSPYNTYMVRGLPPGPIASPGLSSIDAVLYPTESRYLYFVSKNDGSHHFSATLREHSAAVRKYQIDYFRSQRRRQSPPTGPS